MTIIFGPVKSAPYHPDVSEATPAYSACTIDVLEARRRTTLPPTSSSTIRCAAAWFRKKNDSLMSWY
jgi:hypothetical protein